MSRSRIRFRRPDLWKPVSGAMQAVPPADCQNGWGYVRREDYAALEFEYRLALIKLASAGKKVAGLVRRRAEVMDARNEAILMWHKHCDSFSDALGKAPPSVVIDAMLEFAAIFDVPVQGSQS
ncbi:MAG: hypothetical protein RL758_143 [Pseudomonadota bacterium]|jgi:hypothetical protein